MKKALGFLVSVLILAPFIAFAAFPNDLQYGSKGEGVIELQEFLTAQGVYNGPVTGNFYSLTLNAVKKFQTAQSITPVSGYWGPKSRGVANKILSLQSSGGNATAPQNPTDLSVSTPTPSTGGTIFQLPNGAIVEVSKDGNIRWLVQPTQNTPAATNTNSTNSTQNAPLPTPTVPSPIPVSRTLSVSSPLNGIPEWHVRREQSSAKVHEFRLFAGGNTATNISAIRVSHFDLGSFTTLWVGTEGGIALGGKIIVETSYDSSGNVTMPFSTSLNPNTAQNFVIYADIASNAPQGTINQMYLIDVLSDAGGAFGIPLTGPAVKTDYPAEPVVSNVSLGFSGSVITHLDFTSDQDIFCGSNQSLTKTCVLEGQKEVTYNLGICNGVQSGSYFIFEKSKTYICEIYARNVDGVAAHYKHTFMVPQ